MSERAPGGQQPTEQQTDVTTKQENPAAQTAESRAKSPSEATEAITAVKSKIKEKTSSLVQEDKEALGKAPKLSSSKLNKFSKRKRSKSRSNETLESQEPVEEAKTEPAPPETLQAESFYLESKMAINMSAVSKKSLVTPEPMSKSSRRLTPPEDRREDELQQRPSDIKKSITEDSLSTFVISHDVEQAKEEPVNPARVEEDIGSRRSTAQKYVHERGNYMSNVSPAPMEDYSRQTQEEENKKEKPQQQ